MKKEFLDIIKTFMREETYMFPEEFAELQELYRFCQVHKMTAAVFEQIRNDAIWDKEEHQALMNVWKRSSIMDVMLQVQREEGFLQVYDKLLTAGVKPLVVKGIVCRKLFCKPDYRISADEDMLILEGDFAKCDEILLANGFARGEVDIDHLPQEIPYRNPKNGTYIELHFQLFARESGAYGYLNEEFSHVFDNCICETIKGTDVWTLSPTEHMFYLICHSFKHFLHSGFGIRQVCDMVMLAEAYGSAIDLTVIEEKLVRLHMDSFWAGLAEIGRIYLGFDWEKSAYPARMQRAYVGMEELLEDLLDSGIYGNSSSERKHSSNMTLSAAGNGKKDTFTSLKESLFPGAEYMKNKYSWVNRCPWLLPLGWLVRMAEYLGKREKSVEEQASSLQIGMERVELMKKYRIIR